MAFVSRLKFLVASIVISTLVGCAANPFKVAETPEQRAFALFGTFVALEETAADIIEDPNVSEEVKARIRTTDQQAQPIVQGMYDAAQLVVRLRAEYGVDPEATPLQRVTSAIQSLENWIIQARPVVAALQTAIAR
jgi:hypothetical protein